MTMEPGLLLAVLVFLLVAGAVLVVGRGGDSKHGRIERRLIGYSVAQRRAGVQHALSVLREKQYSRIPWLDALLRHADVGERLSVDLVRAGVPMRSGEFLLLQLALAAVAAAGVWLGLGASATRLPLAAVAALLGFAAPRLWLRFKRARRLAGFERNLADALDLAAGSLRAGYGIAHGLDLVARETTGPCAEEFGQVLQEINLGADLDVALAHLVERIPSEDARLLATAVGIQRRTGGNLVEVIGMMSAMLRERFRLRGEVRTITTAPRISGYVVACLPVGTAVMMFLTSRYYIEMLLSQPLGQVALAVSGALTLMGLYLNRRIAQVEL